MARRKSIDEKQSAQNIRALKKQASEQYKTASKDADAARKYLKKQLAELAKADKERLAAYRRKLAALKRAGIIGDINTRAAPFDRKLQRKIDTYKDVAEGRAVLRKAPKSTRDKAKSVGMRTFGNKVVIPKIKGERVYVSKKDGQIYKRLNRGHTKLKIIPVLERPQNFLEWAEQQKQILGTDGGYTKNRNRYGFKMFGHDGYVTFSSLDNLIMYLTRYLQDIDTDDYEELLDNLVVIEMTRDEAEKFEAAQSERRRIRKLNKRANKNKRARQRYAQTSAGFAKWKEANAKRRMKAAMKKQKMIEDFRKAADAYNKSKQKK